MKTRFPLITIFTALTGIACLSGCSSTVNTVEPAQPMGLRQMVDDKRVITDTALNDKVNVYGINTTTTPGGFLCLRVDVVNRRSSVQHFNYKIEWFDVNGMPVTTAGGGWLEGEILGRETKSITAVAPSPNCKDFRIQFIESLH